MKKLQLTLIAFLGCLLLSYNVIGQTSSDTVVSYDVNDDLYQRFIRTGVDSNGMYEKSIMQHRTTSDWKNYSKTEATWNSDNNHASEFTYYGWSDSGWVLSGRNGSNYDSVSLLRTRYYHFNYNTSTSSWDTFNFRNYFYDNNNLVKIENIYPRTSSGTISIDSFYYDSNRRTAKSITGLLPSPDHYSDNTYQTLYQYNASGLVDTIISQYRDTQANEWVNSARYIHIYSASNNDSTYNYIREDWKDSISGNGGYWELATYITRHYDINGNLIERIIGEYDSQGQDVPKSRNILEYDINKNPIKGEFESYNNGNWIADDGYLYIFYPYFGSTNQMGVDGHRYEAFSSNENNGGVGIGGVELFNAFTLYPNPAQHQLTIQSEQEEINAFYITDMTGRTVLVRKGLNHKKVNIPTHHLAVGIYMLQVQSGSKVGVRQFVVQH